uniref:Major facilitator superfamily (MFS) profile domain-containing protein n=1 Tax=Trichobilharzia regenti TaxID=157069 RepID=A0AA85IW94_TRIRE|nr:unnamed protein product [Trichobilharzia regenti]
MVDESKYKDGGWAWVVVFGAFISHFMTCGFEKGYSVLYVEIIRVYNTSAALSAALGGFASAVRLLLAPLSVSLSNIYSEQKVAMAGGLLTFIGLLTAALSPHFTIFFIAYGAVFGFGLTLSYTPSLVVCTHYFHKRRATALSLSLAGCGVATIILPYLFYFLISYYGLRGAMIILSAFSLHYCVAGALYYQREPKKDNVQDSEPSKVKLSISSRVVKYISRLLKIKVASGIWVKIFLLSFILNMMGSSPVTTLLIDHAEQLGYIGGSSVQLLMIEGTVQLVVRIALGFFFDNQYIKPYRGLIWTGGVAFSSLIIIFIAFATDLKLLSSLMFFRGASLALYISQQAVVVSDLCEGQPETTSQTIAIAQICKGIGTLLGSYFSGLIKDYTQEYRPAFLFLGGMQFLGFLTVLCAIIWARINARKRIELEVSENLIHSSSLGNISDISSHVLNTNAIIPSSASSSNELSTSRNDEIVPVVVTKTDNDIPTPQSSRI